MLLLLIEILYFLSVYTLSCNLTYRWIIFYVSLLSIGRLIDLGYHVNSIPGSCVVQDPQTGVQIGIGHKKGGLCELEHLHIPIVVTTIISQPIRTICSI